MKTLRSIEVVPVFCENTIPDKPSEYKEGHIYISARKDIIAFNCLCGCGSFTRLPVNQVAEGWQLEIDSQKRITIIGSVLQLDCKAHYIITKNKANFV